MFLVNLYKVKNAKHHLKKKGFIFTFLEDSVLKHHPKDSPHLPQVFNTSWMSGFLITAPHVVVPCAGSYIITGCRSQQEEKSRIEGQQVFDSSSQLKTCGGLRNSIMVMSQHTGCKIVKRSDFSFCRYCHLF